MIKPGRVNPPGFSFNLALSVAELVEALCLRFLNLFSNPDVFPVQALPIP